MYSLYNSVNLLSPQNNSTHSHYPDVRRKAWGPGRKHHGQRRSLRHDSRPLLADKPSTWRSEERRRVRKRPSSQAPKVHMFKCLCVGCSFNKKIHTFSQIELFPPHSVNTAPLAPHQSSAQLPLTQVIAAHPTFPPLRFNGVVQSLTLPRNAQVLRQEVCFLLKKGAVERVLPSELETGFYSRYFVVPKRDWGIRPILDLRPINRALYKRPFRMITLNRSRRKIAPGTDLRPWI